MPESPDPSPAAIPSQKSSRAPLPLRIFAGAENLLLAFSLAVMILLPLAEAVSRRFFSASVPQASIIVQHLVLIVALVGGAVAAREGRLLSLSTLGDTLRGRWGVAARIIAAAGGAAISTALAWASVEFAQIGSGQTIAAIPLDKLLLLMPFCFALAALRLVWRAGSHPVTKIAAFLLAAAMVAGAALLPLSDGRLLAGAFVLLFICAVFGMPIYTVLGGAAVILFLSKGEPLAAISISQYDMAVNPTLAAVPLFTLAGYFLAEGGASRRLVRVFHALFGHLRGGAGVMTVLVCTFFTSFTGASGVTILALGGLLMPVLLDAKYSERTSLGIITGAGSLGLLLPPCLPLILYAIVASNAGVHLGVTVGITEMFAAGLIPGLLLAGMAVALVIFQQPRSAAAESGFSLQEAISSTWEAKWELLLPVVAIGALLGGFATPVEAAALTALYAFVVETFVYRDLHPVRDTPRVLVESGLLVGGILLILGVAMGLTNYLVDAQVPDRAVDWAKAALAQKWMFLLALNLLLIAVGCLMDIFSALVIVVPIIVPVAIAFDVDLLHLGVIFLANLQLGYLTPPVGMNLFMTSYRFGKPMPEVVRAIIPMLLVFAVGVAAITIFPELTTALPNALGLRSK